MEVRYHIRLYFVGISPLHSPYIGFIFGRYLPWGGIYGRCIYPYELLGTRNLEDLANLEGEIRMSHLARRYSYQKWWLSIAIEELQNCIPSKIFDLKEVVIYIYICIPILTVHMHTCHMYIYICMYICVYIYK